MKTLWCIIAFCLAMIPRVSSAQPDLQTSCVVEAAWHEARGATRTDRWGVIRTILNRTKHSDQFSKTPCGVAFQKDRFKNKVVYQFSWSRTQKYTIYRDHDRAYQEILKLVDEVRRTPPKGCEKDILYFAPPKIKIGVKVNSVCMKGAMNFYVPAPRVTYVRYVANKKARRKKIVT